MSRRGAALSETTISVALPFPSESTRGDTPGAGPATAPVYAFLPVRDFGMRFAIQADWLLPASREDVLSDNAWNEWLRGQVPNVLRQAIDGLAAATGLPPGVRLSWLRLMPPVGSLQGSFFRPLGPLIESELRSCPCLPAAHTGPQGLIKPCEGLIAPLVAVDALDPLAVQRTLGRRVIDPGLLSPEGGPSAREALLRMGARDLTLGDLAAVLPALDGLQPTDRLVRVLQLAAVLASSSAPTRAVLDALGDVLFVPTASGRAARAASGVFLSAEDASSDQPLGDGYGRPYGFEQELDIVDWPSVAAAVPVFEDQAMIRGLLELIGVHHVTPAAVIQRHVLPRLLGDPVGSVAVRVGHLAVLRFHRTLVPAKAREDLRSCIRSKLVFEDGETPIVDACSLRLPFPEGHDGEKYSRLLVSAGLQVKTLSRGYLDHASADEWLGLLEEDLGCTSLLFPTRARSRQWTSDDAEQLGAWLVAHRSTPLRTQGVPSGLLRLLTAALHDTSELLGCCAQTGAEMVLEDHSSPELDGLLAALTQKGDGEGLLTLLHLLDRRISSGGLLLSLFGTARLQGRSFAVPSSVLLRLTLTVWVPTTHVSMEGPLLSRPVDLPSATAVPHARCLLGGGHLRPGTLALLAVPQGPSLDWVLHHLAWLCDPGRPVHSVASWAPDRPLCYQPWPQLPKEAFELAASLFVTLSDLLAAGSDADADVARQRLSEAALVPVGARGTGLFGARVQDCSWLPLVGKNALAELYPGSLRRLFVEILGVEEGSGDSSTAATVEDISGAGPDPHDPIPASPLQGGFLDDRRGAEQPSALLRTSGPALKEFVGDLLDLEAFRPSERLRDSGPIDLPEVRKVSGCFPNSRAPVLEPDASSFSLLAMAARAGI